MLEARQRPTIVELDTGANEPGRPYGIVTADCSSPREIDDGVFVQPLPSSREAYRVGVCVADTSRLYDNSEVRGAVIEHPRAEYGQDGSGSYRPMVGPDLIRRHEFKRRPGGNIRRALVVSFVVGEDNPPDQTEVEFGHVEVLRNHHYKRFGYRCRYSDSYEPYGRASAFIIHHLGYTTRGPKHTAPQRDVNSIYRQLMHVPPHLAWERGSTINESFMVAANHLVGRMLAEEEDRVAIYRVHDPADMSTQDFLPPALARYSSEPGPHVGLSLTPYCRVTSPLRRGEDFVMSHLLRERSAGRPVTGADRRVVATTIQRLNQLIMSDMLDVPAQPRTHRSTGFAISSRRLLAGVSAA